MTRAGCVPQTEEPGLVCLAGHEDSPALHYQDWHRLVGHCHLPYRQDSPAEEKEEEI